MDTPESGKRVMHRGRVLHERRDEEAEALGEVPARTISAEELQQKIAIAAYFRAEGRNFEPGRELEDWLAAEAQIDDMRSAEA